MLCQSTIYNDGLIKYLHSHLGRKLIIKVFDKIRERKIVEKEHFHEHMLQTTLFLKLSNLNKMKFAKFIISHAYTLTYHVRTIFQKKKKKSFMKICKWRSLQIKFSKSSHNKNKGQGKIVHFAWQEIKVKAETDLNFRKQIIFCKIS